MSTLDQQKAALAKGNRVRLEAAQLRHEVKAGTLSVSVALDDPRAAPMTIERLLMSQERWGRQRVRHVLVGARWATIDWPQVIWPDTLVRDLTARQKAVLRGMLG